MLQKLVLGKSRWGLSSAFMLYMLILASLSVLTEMVPWTEAILQGTLAALSAGPVDRGLQGHGGGHSISLRRQVPQLPPEGHLSSTLQLLQVLPGL